MLKTVEVTIDDKEYSAGFLGRKFRLGCVAEIRARRHASFLQAIANLPSDPISIASQVGTAIDAHMTSVIVEDRSINEWLLTPEGFYFAFKTSLKIADKDIADDKIDDLHDMLGIESAGKLRDFWGRSMNGSAYDDVIKAIQTNVTTNIFDYYDADEETIEDFRKYRLSINGKAEESAPEVAAEPVTTSDVSV